MNNICEKHKLPITHVCLFIGCMKERLICHKCSNSHKQHFQNVTLLENQSRMEFQDLVSFSDIISKNNKSLTSPMKPVGDNNEQFFELNKFANLNFKTHIQQEDDEAFKNSFIQNNYQSNLSELKINENNQEETQQKCEQAFEERNNNFQDQEQCNKFEHNFVTKQKSQDEFNGQSMKSDNFDYNLQKPNKPSAQYENNKNSQDSVFTRILENECFSLPCQLSRNSQIQSNLSTQTLTTQEKLHQDNNQFNKLNHKMKNSFNIQDSYNPNLHHPQEGKLKNSIQQNAFMLAPNIPYNLQANSKQNKYSQQFQHQGFLPLQFPFTSSKFSTQKQQQEESKFNQKYIINQNKYLQIESITQNKNKEENMHVEKLLNQKKQLKSNHENELIDEIMEQDENIQKICLFLRSMNDIKKSLCDKIDSIKQNFLNSIQMQEEDFSCSFQFDSLATNRTLIDEKLKNNFSKLKQLNQFFENNQIIYNTSTTSRSKQIQLEQEIDRILSFNVQKIDSEKEKLSKTNIQQVDFSLSDSEYSDFFEYYNKSPAKIDVIKSKINSFQPYQIEFDGISKGIPGRSGAGFLIRDTTNDKSILEYSIEVGSVTINQAQYLALLYGMHACFKLGIKQIRIQGEAEVIIKQMQGIYQVRSPQLKEYFNLTKLLEQNFYSKEYNLVKKEFNIDANSLAISALI